MFVTHLQQINQTCQPNVDEQFLRRSFFVTYAVTLPCLLMQFLEHYKLELARRRFGPATAEKGGAAASEEPPAKKPRIDLDRKYSGESHRPLHLVPSSMHSKTLVAHRVCWMHMHFCSWALRMH